MIKQGEHETPEGILNRRVQLRDWNPFWDKRVNTYTNDFEYSIAGKIKRKNQNNTGLLTETGQTVTITETTYDWTYEYGGTHPNAVTKAGTRDFVYDLNGNMTTMTDTAKSLTRTLLWDEENRLKKTTDASGTNSSITTYSYDAKGMRAIKKGKYGTVQYVSENYVVRNKDLISKHVFAGNTRLVSKTVMQEEKSGKMVATEQGSYFYHPDHLGSNSVVTDKQGKFYEQLEYFPYGETWIHNKADTEQESTPYKFTAKELDVETGLYYFGYRYLDPKLSCWISADPAMVKGEYLPLAPINDNAKKQNSNLPGMGGVFNTINLVAYQYAGQNPIKFTDPDGNANEDNNSTSGCIPLLGAFLKFMSDNIMPRDFGSPVEGVSTSELEKGNRISDDYGYRIHPITKKGSFHGGIDIVGRKDAKVLASKDGILEFFDSGDKGYGYHAIIKHADGTKTVYGHLKRDKDNQYQPGEVMKGQAIGIQGSTGASTGDHVHFEIRDKQDKTVNPINYLNDGG